MGHPVSTFTYVHVISFPDCDKPRHPGDAPLHRLRVPSLDVGARRPASHLQTGQGLRRRNPTSCVPKKPTDGVLGEKNIQRSQRCERACGLTCVDSRKEGRICISVVQLAAECLRTLKCVDLKKG